LVRHLGVDKIAFTGSTATGRRIASILSERIGRYTLELGGKGAAVVLDDYDIERAASTLVQATCSMTGQICGALSRVIVSKRRHDAMVEALASAFSTVKVGDPFAPDSQMGPLSTRSQRDRVERYIQSGREDGFKLAFGGGRPRGLDRGFYVEPTLFAGVDNRSTIAQEEIFGPVLVVIPAADEADAIRLTNDTIYGLSNAVFTNDADRAYAVARQMRSGTVGHNGMLADFAIGFGGFKQSGVGREGGVEGLRPYLESKTILLQGAPRSQSAKA
jgi:betaine-aldehyde dehydrogenase